jgi:hypothetical protein
MKTTYIFSLLIALGLLSSLEASGQCNSDAFVSASVAGMTPGYSLLKSYKIAGEKDLEKMEFSYVLTKGTQYMLNIKDDAAPAPATVVTLFDSKRNKIASNKISGSTASAIAFACGATGIYYIQYTFESSSQRCAGSTLAFRR